MKYFVFLLGFWAIISCQNKVIKESGSVPVYSLNRDSTTVATDFKPTVEVLIEKTTYKDSLTYEMTSFYRTTAKSSNPKDSGEYAYVRAVYPKFSNEKAFLNSKVLSIITSAPWTGEKANNLEKASQAFFKDYLAVRKDMPEAPGNYFWDETLEVSFQDLGLLVLSLNNYTYTGGAHGMGNTIYYNLDLKNEKEIALNELFVDGYAKKLNLIAENIFRKNEGLSGDEPLNDYFFDKKTFTLNNNFRITHSGLLFTYNAYEIKPYSDGPTDLLIPYENIKQLIQPNSFISKYIKK